MSGIGIDGFGYNNAYMGMSGFAGTDFSTVNKADIAYKLPGIGTVDKEGKVHPAEKTECQTCKERKYQDGSDEANVSFKNAAHVAPEAAGSAVRAHEGMHVTNAYAKASRNGGKVLQASVAIHTGICPECGRTYVSGGTTTTKIKYGNEDNPYTKNRKNLDRGLLSGMNFDAAG